MNSVFDRVILSNASRNSSIFFIVCLQVESGGPDNIIIPLGLFSIKENDLFRCGFCWHLLSSAWFLIHDEYGIGLHVSLPNKSVSQWLFWQSRYSGKRSKVFIYLVSESVFFCIFTF